MKTKNSKKVLALILSFFMILTVLPFNVMASGDETDPNAPKSGDQTTKYDVTYVVKGIEGTEKTFAKQQVESGKTVTLPNDTAVEGYKFKGFFEDEQGTKAFNAEKQITEATTIYAIYEKEAPVPAKKELTVSATVYYDAIAGTVTDQDRKAVEGATVSVGSRTTTTDSRGYYSFNMTSESKNYYCGYYGYYWKDYPYDSYKVTTTTGSYTGYNSTFSRYFFLVDAKGNIVDSTYAVANSEYHLNGNPYTSYTVYGSESGYAYGYNYPYYGKYNYRYYNPNTAWAKNMVVVATMKDYEKGTITLGNVTNNSWLYTTCYEYGYPYGYDRVIYPSALSLSGNGTIVSGKVGVSYLPIYVYRNGVYLGSGNADVNGYFSIGLNSRVSSTSDLTFYAYGKGQVAPEKKSEKADHGVIPVKSTVVIGSTKLIKNINGVEADVNMDVAPFIRDGRTMLPLRYIAEALGFKVDWDRATRTVTLTDKEFKVQIPVESNKIIVNGSTYYSDANPVLRNGRTMLPVANIARALGLKDGTDILWDANTRVATITRLVKY
ncbi:stalk domain-containing protein [Peptoniphilus sp. BV3AC2]|uniref:stalk domain-containing protein n=1 Tax=Peptoniphilus sp. BV3AC2 TaxID=1111133 RepID=UPI0003B8B023|nr:stalk domain-containing protein [Peptoniphilus sp. BV3AC2]ERT64572.1 copper amine oxidase N-terminal domain protein [Peptoniphilus sp. BV3AC2]